MDESQDVRQQFGRGDRTQDGHRRLGGTCHKGQELREMTRDLDLLKVDVDTIAMVIRLRGVSAAAGARAEDAVDNDPEREDA
jgi:hypothetical protein